MAIEIIDFATGQSVTYSREDLIRQKEIEEKQRPIREAWFKKVDEFNEYLERVEGDPNVSSSEVFFRLIAMMKADKKYRDDMNAIDGGHRTTVLQDAIGHASEPLSPEEIKDIRNAFMGKEKQQNANKKN